MHLLYNCNGGHLSPPSGNISVLSPPVTWSRFSSELLSVSTMLDTLRVSSLVNAVLTEQGTGEVSPGVFFNSSDNCCIVAS